MADSFAEDLPEHTPLTGAAELELPSTGLRVVQGELIRITEGQQITMRLPLDDIETVSATRVFDPHSLTFVFAGGGLITLGLILVEDRWLMITLCLTGLISLMIASGGMWTIVLVIGLKGEELRIRCTDQPDEVSGFAASLRSRTGSHT